MSSSVLPNSTAPIWNHVANHVPGAGSIRTCRPRAGSDVSVYVDHAFAFGDWGRWTGGGHLQADSPAELHEFADRMGLRREWFQSKPGRPENDHYDLTARGRDLAIRLGAIAEERRAGARRRRAVRLRAEPG